MPQTRHESHQLSAGRVDIYKAWTVKEIDQAVEQIFQDRAAHLPTSRKARLVIKPNLNNDLIALTGNCVDLRVLGSLLKALRKRSYTDITVADGPNVGIDRRDIDSFRRLRVDRLCKRYDVRLVNINRDPGERVPLSAGARPAIGRVVQKSDFLISVPKIKTHAEVGLSCAMKNWVGIACGQDKRQMHYDLSRNIFAINEIIRPDLIVVDGLVGMEGNGPGDGDPFRLGIILASDNAFLNDLFVARAMAFPWNEIPYLVHALDAGRISNRIIAEVENSVPVIRPISRPPARSRLARLSESRKLLWLKHMVRPLVERPVVAQTAYRLRIIQDVYNRQSDTLQVAERDTLRCADCRRCEDFCPTGLPLERIGKDTAPEDCIHCLYCWFVCPRDAITLIGQQNHLARQVTRHKSAISSM